MPRASKKSPAKKKPIAAAIPRRTNNDIYAVVLDVREDVIEVKQRMVDLKEHVNEEIELLRKDFSRKIDGKLDSAALLTSVGFRLLNNQWVRWGFSGVILATLATLSLQHWAEPVSEGARFVLRLVFGRVLP